MYKHTNKRVFVEDLGLMDYAQAWEYQTRLFDAIVHQKVSNRDLDEDSIPPSANYLLFCEHPHVYTLGKSGKKENLLISDRQLADKQASYYEINRGGDITYHGPGQLVGYPILDLDNFFTDIHKYLRLLEEAVILTLADFGLQAGRIEGLTGVWVDPQTPLRARKICAMGVKASRWVTMHGFALNIHPDLTYFNNIVPCGIDDKAVTSMEKELGEKPDIRLVKKQMITHLATLFGMKPEERTGTFNSNNP